MKRLACVLLFLPLIANSDTPLFTEEQAKKCEDEGGCLILTAHEIRDMLRGAEMYTRAQERKACVFGGVGRDS